MEGFLVVAGVKYRADFRAKIRLYDISLYGEAKEHAKHS